MDDRIYLSGNINRMMDRKVDDISGNCHFDRCEEGIGVFCNDVLAEWNKLKGFIRTLIFEIFVRIFYT